MDMYNFSAGPAMLPREVMKKAQEEFCNYRNSGSGIMELSHRGSLFTEVIERAEQNIRDLMNISDDYAVIFVQGGASMQFCMIPMNLLPAGATADYADTGVWGAKAAKEAGLKPVPRDRNAGICRCSARVAHIAPLLFSRCKVNQHFPHTDNIHD